MKGVSMLIGKYLSVMRSAVVWTAIIVASFAAVNFVFAMIRPTMKQDDMFPTSGWAEHYVNSGVYVHLNVINPRIYSVTDRAEHHRET